jgi:hypothetical protein
MIESKRMSCTGHVECIGVENNGYRGLIGNVNVKRPLRSVVSKLVLHKWHRGTAGLIWLRTETSVVLL